MLKLLTIAILSAIITVQSSPLKPPSLYQTVTSNKNISKLVNNPETLKFWNECRLPKTDICYLLFNTALELSKRGLEFTTKTRSPNTVDEFCKEFNKVIPRSSEFIETTSYFVKHEEELDGICTSGCNYTSVDTYTNKIKPVCNFLFGNFVVLKNTDIKKDPEVKVAKIEPLKLAKNVEKSPPQLLQQQNKVAVPIVVPNSEYYILRNFTNIKFLLNFNFRD